MLFIHLSVFFCMIVISRKYARIRSDAHGAWFSIHCQLKTKNLFTAHTALPMSLSSPAFVAAFSLNIRLHLQTHIHTVPQTHIHWIVYSGRAIHINMLTRSHISVYTIVFFINGELLFVGRAIAQASASVLLSVFFL